MTAPLPPATDAARAHRPADALSIFCLLPTLSPYGGVICAVSAVNLWIAQGHRVTLASLSRDGNRLIIPRTEPIFLMDPDDIRETIKGTFDILLATSWHTVDPILQLAERGGVPWYYVQDYEPMFYSDEGTQRVAAATYPEIANRIVMTGHLANIMAEHGWETHKISTGLDLDIFYPRDTEKQSKRILGMARPPAADGSDHRGYGMLRALYERLAVDRPDLELCVFGAEGLDDLPASVTNFGRVDPSDLPGLFSSAAVCLDTSRWHGWGRTGIEAMACGTPPVLAASGGIDEYALHEENALIVPVDDVEAAVAAIIRIVDDPDLAERLGANGRETARFCDDRVMAQGMIDLFRASLDS